MKILIVASALLIGLALLTQVLVNRVERHYPPIGNSIEVDGLKMHYLEAGTGPTVILIHGASTNLRDFHASIFEPLSKQHRVIAVDRPGHGYSERPEGRWPDPAEQARLIRALLHKLHVTDPILVGHSWSGSVVLAYLLAFPAEAAGGVLFAGGSHPWRGGVAWHANLAVLPGIGEIFARTIVYPLGMLAMEGGVRRVFAPNTVPEHYIERTGVQLSLRPKEFLANAADLRGLSDFLVAQSRRYSEIQHPLLLVTGAADDIVPAWNHADRLIQQVTNAKIIRLEDTGHALHHVHPHRVVGFIEDFSGKRVVGIKK